ncbi:MAG: hypothetical protein QW057_04230 [Candidatus Bathyarchaeia archaeon]
MAAFEAAFLLLFRLENTGYLSGRFAVKRRVPRTSMGKRFHPDLSKET